MIPVWIRTVPEIQEALPQIGASLSEIQQIFREFARLFPEKRAAMPLGEELIAAYRPSFPENVSRRGNERRRGPKREGFESKSCLPRPRGAARVGGVRNRMSPWPKNF